MKDPQAKESEDVEPSKWQVFSSVFAAAFGVQSSKNRERDFKQGRFIYYALAGLLFTLVLLVSIFTIVNVVLAGTS